MQLLEGRSDNGQFLPGGTPWNKGEECPQLAGENNGFYGRKHTEEAIKKNSDKHKGKKLSSETKAKLSDSMKGKHDGAKNPFYGKRHTAETLRKLSEMGQQSWDDRYGKETADRMRREQSEWARENSLGNPPSYPKPYIVLGIPHIVRSSWEEEIAIMLLDANIDYDYENRFPILIDEKECSYNADFTFDIDGKKYVVEPHGWFNEHDYLKFEAFNEQYPDITFIILAGEEPNKEICDIFIDWEDRNSLIDKIQEDLKCRGQR